MAQSNKEMRSHLSNLQNSLQKANAGVTSPTLLNSSWAPSATREPWVEHFTSLNWILPYICQPITLILSMWVFRKRDFIFTTAIKDTLTITVASYKHQFKWFLNEYLKIPFSLHLQHILDLLRVRNDNPLLCCENLQRNPYLKRTHYQAILVPWLTVLRDPRVSLR